MKFYNSTADALLNDKFLFIYSQGCLPGNFEGNCIAEHLTTSTRHGCFSVVMNSRYGFGEYNSTDGPSNRFDRQFFDAYFSENIKHFGALNADSHEDNLWDINEDCIRWCYYETNLLGDPETDFRFAKDTDNDGIPDVDDNCPETPNSADGGTCARGTLGQSCMSDNDCDAGWIEGVCSMNQEDEGDEDGIGDVCDNCPFHYNLDQIGSDENGVGDACEAYKGDVNNDETINVCDVQLIINIFLGVSPSPTDWELWAADCDNNESINVADIQIDINKILGVY